MATSRAASSSSFTADLRARYHRFRDTRFWRIARWPFRAGLALGVLGVLGLAYLYATVSLPDEPPEHQSSVILDSKGREIAVLARDGRRIDVELDEVSPMVVDALIAAEDRNFRSHNGIDPKGLARAVVNNVGGGDTQGGSTITQQLVKNSYLTSERTYTRKLKEAVLAIKLDRSEDKDEILERYLNVVYFGRGTYGIESASKAYFDKSAKDLTLPEAALLVGLLRAPESADPTRSPDVATARRNSVLDDLAEVGKITVAEATEAKATDLGATELQSPTTLSAGVGPHVVEWIRAEMVEKFGAEVVYGGGLTIHTTIDLDDQRAAEVAIASTLNEPDDPQAALVGLDDDGGIKAYVGGRDYDILKVDLARGAAGGGSGRQPGSTFKPMVLAAALEDGVATLGTTYPAPGKITLDTGGEPWAVSNYGGAEKGVQDLNAATASSTNTVYAQLMLDVGPDRAREVAADLGIEGELPNQPSLVLGTGEVSVLEMAGAYSTFGRDGTRLEPYVVSKVEDDDGAVIFEEDRPEPTRAVEEGTARAVNHALRGVIEGGSGSAARLDRPAAGKTGTTQDNGDAWFAGYTPNYTAVVWMGYPEGPQRKMSDVHGRAVTGGSFPAEIWKRFMDLALADVEPADFGPVPPELLEPLKRPEAELTLSPDSGPPGTEVAVSGTGFEQCLAGWSVAMEPGGQESPNETGSTADERTASLTVPADLEEESVTITARCDRGSGPEGLADVVFRVDQPEPSTTTSSSTTSTTSTTVPEDEPEEPPATTTTAPEPEEEEDPGDGPGGGGAGGGGGGRSADGATATDSGT